MSKIRRLGYARELGRVAFVQVRVDDDGEVWIGGKTQTVIRGVWNGVE